LISEKLQGIEFDLIHAFRMHMAPLALTLARRNGAKRPRLVLDLDVYESEAAHRQTLMMRGTAGFQWYWLHRLEAAKYSYWEWRYLRSFDQLWVCSDEDRGAMERRYRAANVHTVRNGFAVPAAPLAAADPGVFTFLFVGTMSYSANEDGILFFCREVLPLLRAQASAPFRVMIVGRGPTAEVQKLAELPEVTVTGAVADVGEYYRNAQAVIAPLRLGGGTRIKILEAFSYGVPVIATSIGAAGIEATKGKDILVADSPDAFAGQCAAIMSSPAFRQQIARSAFDLASSRYSLNAIRRVIHERLAPTVPAPALIPG
jgi:glycosyltransferase involved in cell wall biosynthesis